MDEQIKSLISEQENSPEPLDFKEYWRVVDRFKWRILLFSLAVTTLSVVYAYSLTPQYSSTATLMIDAEKANTTSIKEIYDLDVNNRTYHTTQIEILKSRKLAEKVINKLDLFNRADFNQLREQVTENKQSPLKDPIRFLSQQSSESGTELADDEVDRRVMQRAVEIFTEKLALEPIRNTKLINITFDSADPELAAEVANTLAEIYIQSFLESKLEMTAKATTWMNERLATIKDKLDVAETRLQAFLEREKLVNVRGISGLAQAELDEVSTQHLAAKRLLNQSKNIYDMSNAEGVTLEQLASIPAVLNHPIIQQVKGRKLTAEQRLSELAKRYGPKHPTMIAAEAELVAIHESFNTEVRKLVSGIATEYQTARNNERQLAQQVARAKKEFQRLAIIEREFTNLQAEVDINRQLYTTFFTRLKETSETSGFQTANASILDRAQVAPWPSKPSKRKIVGLTLIGSMLFGIALAFLHDFLSAGIRGLDDIERRLRQRMLGLIPLHKLKKGEKLPHYLFFDKANPGFAEAIRTIRTSLLMSQMDGPQKIIGVTSSIPGEGKSTLATNLAFALGQMEKVLLIDCDLRKPSLGKRFGYPPYQPGLSNLIANSVSLSNCIVTDQRAGIDLMPAGAIPPNPQELLSSDLMKTALKLLSAKYDRIIIDTSPTQAVSDSLVLSTYVDNMIYVVKADSTHFKMIKAGIGRLLQIGCHVAGVVLNQVDLDESAKYGDYSGYYDHYGYFPEEDQVEDSYKAVAKNNTSEKEAAEKEAAEKEAAEKEAAEKEAAEKEAAEKEAAEKEAAEKEAAEKEAAEKEAAEKEAAEKEAAEKEASAKKPNKKKKSNKKQAAKDKNETDEKPVKQTQNYSLSDDSEDEQLVAPPPVT